MIDDKITRIIRESIFRLLTEEDSGVIEPTVAWVKQKYNEFNAKYFDNFLPKCYISVKPLGEKAGYVLGGTFRFMNRQGFMNLGDSFMYCKNGEYFKLDNKENIYRLLKPTITINSKYKVPIKQLENTIIHEMCHYYNYFNEDGSFRIADRENDGHGEDFLRAAEMISEKSGGEIQIKNVMDAEQVAALAASSYFDKDEYVICMTNYKERPIIWFTKYPDIWVKFAFSMLLTSEINVTSDSQVLMLLRRYKFKPCTYTTKNINAYFLDNAPSSLTNAVNNAKFVTVTKENYNSIFEEN